MNAGPSTDSRSARSTPSPTQTLPRRRIPGHVQVDALVEGIEVRLPVLVEIADVLPVALCDVAVERLAHLQEKREQLLREVVGAIGRDALQDLGFEHVDPGVDRVRENLAPGGLLEEALDPTAPRR